MRRAELSRREKIQIFLNEYYLGYGFVFSFLRIAGGPLVTAMGSYLYLHEPPKPGMSYAGFMIIFGIYYSLKPIILILTRKAWFKNFDLGYHFEAEKLIIRSGKSMTDLAYADLAAVLKRKNYFAVRMRSKQTLYLPVKSLKPEEIYILEGLKKN